MQFEVEIVCGDLPGFCRELTKHTGAGMIVIGHSWRSDPASEFGGDRAPEAKGRAIVNSSCFISKS
jgi:hypothetical protein